MLFSMINFKRNSFQISKYSKLKKEFVRLNTLHYRKFYIKNKQTLWSCNFDPQLLSEEWIGGISGWVSWPGNVPGKPSDREQDVGPDAIENPVERHHEPVIPDVSWVVSVVHIEGTIAHSKPLVQPE